VSCRHERANGTCIRCYPKTGTIDPGPESDYEPNMDYEPGMEGPGAVTLEEYQRQQEATNAASTDSPAVERAVAFLADGSAGWRERRAGGVMPSLWYYGHSYGGKPENLARARVRFSLLKVAWSIRYPERVLWAPWFGPAEAGVSESDAWLVIFPSIRVCAGVVLDLDGAPMSSGLCLEKHVAEETGIGIERVDGDDFKTTPDEGNDRT
jgi:hypothetical protein